MITSSIRFTIAGQISMSILCLFAVPEIGVNRNQICSDFVTIVAGLVCTDYKLIWCQGWHKPTTLKGDK